MAHRQISIHALREEGDPVCTAAYHGAKAFLSTPSARRATAQQTAYKLARDISIHALREEGDGPDTYRKNYIYLFLSTPSVRRATERAALPTPPMRYFYPRPPRGGRRPFLVLFAEALGHFYPRPPRGGRLDAGKATIMANLFLSTPSARRATAAARRWWRSGPNFYPRPPRGGRPRLSEPRSKRHLFLSTPSARRATQACSVRSSAGYHFYPRPPRGGRPSLVNSNLDLFLFLSTPSARRATACHQCHLLLYFLFLSTPSARRATSPATFWSARSGAISIHALREEGDSMRHASPLRSSHFYPRPPRGGRHQGAGHRRHLFRISIHALREEGDRKR